MSESPARVWAYPRSPLPFPPEISPSLFPFLLPFTLNLTILPILSSLSSPSLFWTPAVLCRRSRGARARVLGAGGSVMGVVESSFSGLGSWGRLRSVDGTCHCERGARRLRVWCEK